MGITDDPIADFNRYDAEQEEAMKKYPECAECGLRITDDYYYEVEGEILCEEHMNERYRKSVDNYVDNYLNNAW